MLEAEVRWSAGQCVRSHRCRTVAGCCTYVRMQCIYVRPQSCTASLSGPRVRTQAREGRTQVCVRPGIGGSAFDRTVDA
jgi:hypothetical protein